MSGGVLESTLVGRADELALVAADLAAARVGEGTARMFFGEPGRGKTTLLDAARGVANDFLVVSCRGVEWEAELPFSGLHELLGPLLGGLQAVPDPQRRALEGVLGLVDVEAVQPLNVYAGALSLLTEATRARPVLIVVDDLQWVDSTTAQVLSFVARRLTGESVVMLIASRPGTMLAGLPTAALELTPLDREAVADLAGRFLGRTLPESAVTDLAAASAGNPLAIVEALRHFGDDLSTRGTLLDEPLPVGELIERAFVDRLAVLATAGRDAVEIIAASISDQGAVLGAAMARAGVDAAGLAEAERAGIIALVGGRIEFSHPLLRALVHRRTPADRLRRWHDALALSLPLGDSLRAWHAASAATLPDEAIAAALESAATRFGTLGGSLAAAQALARAGELTPDPDTAADRLRHAGRAAHFAGRASWAVRLLDDACALAVEPGTRLHCEHERLALANHLSESDDGPERQLALARAAAGLDDKAAAHAYAAAAVDATLAGDIGLTEQSMAGLLKLWNDGDCSPEIDLQVSGAVSLVEVLTGTGDTHRHGVALLRKTGRERIGVDTADHAYVAEALSWVEAYDIAERLCADIVERGRTRGDAFTLIGGLWADGCRRYRIGDWNGAIAVLTESEGLARACGLAAEAAVVAATLAVLKAATAEPTPESVLEEMRSVTNGFGFDVMEEFFGVARGMAALAAGRGRDAVVAYERARDWKRRAHQLEPCAGSWPADLVDAYVLAGDTAKAHDALDELRSRATDTGRRWMLAAVARLDGVLASDDDFEPHFRLALERYEGAETPFDAARAQLSFGQRLRRVRRRVEARDHLTAALATFEQLGAEPWAEQTRRELAASGATIQRGPSFDPDALTPQEQQVAALVVAGASNKEAAGAMFLSPKTIETHLSRIYRKLGVTSRTQLAARLRADGTLD